jgi:hypothetical protein
MESQYCVRVKLELADNPIPPDPNLNYMRHWVNYDASQFPQEIDVILSFIGTFDLGYRVPVSIWEGLGDLFSVSGDEPIVVWMTHTRQWFPERGPTHFLDLYGHIQMWWTFQVHVSGGSIANMIGLGGNPWRAGLHHTELAVAGGHGLAPCEFGIEHWPTPNNPVPTPENRTVDKYLCKRRMMQPTSDYDYTPHHSITHFATTTYILRDVCDFSDALSSCIEWWK